MLHTPHSSKMFAAAHALTPHCGHRYGSRRWAALGMGALIGSVTPLLPARAKGGSPPVKAIPLAESASRRLCICSGAIEMWLSSHGNTKPAPISLAQLATNRPSGKMKSLIVRPVRLPPGRPVCDGMSPMPSIFVAHSRLWGSDFEGVPKWFCQWCTISCAKVASTSS